MSLINELRKPLGYKLPEKEKLRKQEYSPLFMLPLKRNGTYIMTQEKLLQEIEDCKNSGRNWERFLSEHKLSIIPCSMGWKIELKKDLEVMQKCI